MDVFRNTLTASGLLACSIVANSARSETAIIPYVEAGVSDYALEFSGNIPAPDGTLIDTDNQLYFDFTTIKLGLAATINNFYINGYYRTTGDGADTQAPPVPGLPSVKWNGSRDAVSIAAGYNINEAFALFGGYRDSETSGDGSFNSDYSFTHDGWFLGGSYRLDLTETGGLTFSLGYAWLDAQLEQTFVGVDLGKNGGDGSGAKIGAVWRAMFNREWGYTVSAEYYAYDYDLGALEPGSGKIDMEESEAAFQLGLFYVF